MNFNQNCGSKAIVLGMSEGGEKICSAAGRISTQQGTSMEIFEKSNDPQKNASLIKKVTRSGHNSVVEHTFFNIAFCDVTAVVEQFMIEFRLASFTVKSRRYVDFRDCGYFIPEFKKAESEKIYREHIDSIFERYQAFIEGGIPKEDARFILPYCYRSNFYCSLNSRELLNVLRAMIFGRGSKFSEIFNLGKQILSQVQPMCPGIFDGFENKIPSKRDEADFSDLYVESEQKSESLADIIAYTENPEDVAARVALMSDSKITPEQSEEIISSHRSEIIKRLVGITRPRALEAIQFTIRYNSLSLASITHLVRHRMQSIIIPPLTSVDRRQYIIPESVKNNEQLFENYKKTFSDNCSVYMKLRENGESEEALVYLILSGNTLNVVSTMNGRELMVFMKLRTCSRAQWEIQDYANDILFKLRKIAPDIFNHYGPSCYVDGKCPEGALTCGKFSEMQEKFKI